MPVPSRSESGYRFYTGNDLRRLRFIVAAKNQRLPLKLIEKCLTAMDGSKNPCAEIAALLREHLLRLDEQVRAIERTRHFLRDQIASWEKGEIPTSDCLCAILETGALTTHHRRTKMNQSTIELYVANCGLCEQAKELVEEAAAGCGCQVNVYPADSDRARSAGVKAAPTVVKDGTVLFCGLPSKSELEKALGV